MKNTVGFGQKEVKTFLWCSNQEDHDMSFHHRENPESLIKAG